MDRDGAVSFGKEFIEQYQADDASGMSAELAYRWLFALFPFGLFLAALGAFVAAWMGMENPAQQIIDGAGDNLPAGLASSIQPELERVINQQQPGIASIGALAALWAATSGTMTVIKAMNRAYGVEETRGAIKKYTIGIGLTVAGAVGLLVSFVTIVGGALLTEQIASQFGLGATAWALINIARWPLVFLLLVVAVSIVLRIGPNMTPTWRWSLVGGAVFAVGWLLATFLFALYVSNFANYGATYGALAGVIVMMLWLYVTAMILVAAGEVVALLTKRTEPERLEQRVEETRAKKGMPEVAAKVGARLADAKRAVADGVSPTAEGADDEAERQKALKEQKRPWVGPLSPSLGATDRPARPASPPREEGGMPAPVVAALAGAVALGVAWVTTRLPRR